MAELPDVTDSGKISYKPRPLTIFEDHEQVVDEVPSSGPLERRLPQTLDVQADRTIVNNESQKSTTSDSTNSESSSTTTATSAANSTEIVCNTLEKHATEELSALNKKSGHTTLERLGRNPDHHKIKPGDYEKALRVRSKPLFLRRRSLTPLQRLGKNALDKNTSGTGSFRVRFNQILDIPTFETPKNPKTRAEPPSEVLGPAPQKLLPETELGFPNTKGSEDLVIPDSEDESSDALSTPERHGSENPQRTKINLRKFAFKG